MRYIALLLIALAQAAGASENYQLLRSDPEGYAEVLPDRTFEFPRDHLPHPAYRIEWWYLTGNLQDGEGRHYGVQWTLFRQSLSPAPDPGGWQSNQAWMAHAALSLPSGHRYQQRFARGGIGQAGVGLDAAGVFEARMDDWVLRGQGASPLPGELRFSVDGVALNLALHSDTPWVLQGEAGFSQKSPRGQASYYYSQPHIRAGGTLARGDATIRLAGDLWLDREWSSQPLAPDQPGWDWLSLRLEDGHALMAYRLRQDDGRHWLRGNWVSPAGDSVSLEPGDLAFEPVDYSMVVTADGPRAMPLRWRVALPRLGLAWTVEARSPDHWLDVAFPYWEGPVSAAGSSAGQGYLELTGY
jgi:predicted secreted hydrolase